MKIIGHTSSGYLAELSPEEIAAITGKPEDCSHACRSRYGYSGTSNHSIGATFKVCEAWQHLKKIDQTAAERASIAERLRAAATLIEHTPTVMELPEPPSEPQAVS